VTGLARGARQIEVMILGFGGRATDQYERSLSRHGMRAPADLKSFLKQIIFETAGHARGGSEFLRRALFSEISLRKISFTLHVCSYKHPHMRIGMQSKARYA